MPKEHLVKRYSATGRDDTGNKIPIYVYSCSRCRINMQTFSSKSARDKAAEEHKNS